MTDTKVYGLTDFTRSGKKAKEAVTGVIGPCPGRHCAEHAGGQVFGLAKAFNQAQLDLIAAAHSNGHHHMCGSECARFGDVQ
jgi:hypothetical protein